MSDPNTLVLIGGLEPTGRAGVLLDAQVARGHGVQPIVLPTANTAQGATSAIGHTSPGVLTHQWSDAMARNVGAVKVGMVGSARTAETLLGFRQARPDVPWVLDPVLASSPGLSLFDGDLAPLRQLASVAQLVTPNIPELEALAQTPCPTLDDAKRAAVECFPGVHVLIKGGHLAQGRGTDALVGPGIALELPPLPHPAVTPRGTGCFLATSIAAFLAAGLPLVEAIVRARKRLSARALVTAGGSLGALPVGSPQTVGRLHLLTPDHLTTASAVAAFARDAIAGGADTIQLRHKGRLPARTRVDMARALMAVCGSTGTPLVVNDAADVAAVVGAGVHVGAEDLEVADARRLVRHGALVGATANTLEQATVNAATACDYLGVGPVFGTQSKANPAPTLGLARLSEIINSVAPLPVIAIGSIDSGNAAECVSAGAHGVAVLSAAWARPSVTDSVRRIRDALDETSARRAS